MKAFKKTSVILSLTLAVFLIFRIILFIKYQPSFSFLTFSEIISAFLDGFRFDLSIILTFYLLPLAALNLSRNRLWISFWGGLLFFILSGFILFLAGDLVYFNHVKRHVGRELLAIQNDYYFVVDLIFKSYKAEVLVVFIFFIFLFYFWKKIYPLSEKTIKNPLLILFILLLAILGMRGSVSRKNLNVVDAFRIGKSSYGNLCLNGPFTVFHSLLKSKTKPQKFFSDEEAFRLAGLDSKKEYPLLKQYEKKADKPNIVFFLMESLDFQYLDSLSKKGYGVTPNLDKIVQDSLVFTHCFGVGQRSIEGIQACLSGIPPLLGLPYLGGGLELSNFTKLGFLARDEGYSTILMQCFRRRSYRVDSISSFIGFEEFYGKEDFPRILDYQDPHSRGEWDYETFMFLFDRLSHLKEPFLGITLSGTCHGPYPKLPQQFQKYPHSPEKETGYLNTLYYADWSLGEFMKKAEKSPWFKNTVFIITSDHAFDLYRQSAFTERLRIPLIFYSPGRITPGMRKTVCSQLDILPTLIDLMGSNAPFAAWGESVFRKQKGFAMGTEGEVICAINDQGYLCHNLQKRLECFSFNPKISDPSWSDPLEKQLIASIQTVYDLLETNHWAKE